MLTILIMQVTINILFPIDRWSNNFTNFIKLLTSILFLRIILTLPPIIYRFYIQKILLRKNLQPLEKNHNNKITSILFYLASLILRTILAFTAQATFFFSISKNSYILVWPILNSEPIFACYAASLFLKEKNNNNIITTIKLIFFISIIYLLLKLTI